MSTSQLSDPLHQNGRRRAIKDLAAAAAANPIVAADPKTEQATDEYTTALERWTKYKKK